MRQYIITTTRRGDLPTVKGYTNGTRAQFALQDLAAHYSDIMESEVVWAGPFAFCVPALDVTCNLSTITL